MVVKRRAEGFITVFCKHTQAHDSSPESEPKRKAQSNANAHCSRCILISTALRALRQVVYLAPARSWQRIQLNVPNDDSDRAVEDRAMENISRRRSRRRA